MKRTIIELEHKYKNRFVGRHVVRTGEGLKVLGNSRTADIRLLGDDVDSLHAAIEFDQEGWVISDLGSESGTWVKKKTIVAQPLSGTTHVRIGGHDLKIVARDLDHQLFSSKVENLKREGQVYHQVIVKKAGLVVQTLVLGDTEGFEFSYGGKDTLLPAPKDHSWVTKQMGEMTVSQRLVHSDTLALTVKEALQQNIEPSLRKPMIAAGVAFALLMALMLVIPNAPVDEFEPPKVKENRYSRIIFDKKKMRSSKKSSQKLVKKIAGKKASGKKSNNPSKVFKSAAKGSTKQVVTKIKAMGLSKLIGKISKRSAKSADFRVAKGMRATASVSSAPALSGLAAKVSNKNSGKKGYKLAGLGTIQAGKAFSNAQGSGGLNIGNAGNANVGILDEETDIQGGLDKEVIARVIRSHLGQIRYCYERQLSASPELYGKVMVKFTIGSAGGVTTQKVGSSTLKSAMVEGCMLRRIAGWKFPLPQGGTSVLVSYPFLFKSSN